MKFLYYKFWEPRCHNIDYNPSDDSGNRRVSGQYATCTGLGTLYADGGWCAPNKDPGHWYQIELEKTSLVSGVKSQGK